MVECFLNRHAVLRIGHAVTPSNPNDITLDIGDRKPPGDEHLHTNFTELSTVRCSTYDRSTPVKCHVKTASAYGARALDMHAHGLWVNYTQFWRHHDSF